jgi:hypothetical protein
MIEIAEADFVSLDSFPLKWRWTDSRWSELPPEALSTIRPLAEAKAHEIFRVSSGYYKDEGLDESVFGGVVQTRAESGGDSFPGVQRWLSAQVPDKSREVILSWNPGRAAVVAWETFCRYWDDFCYPGADDVAIFPQDEEWALLYHHEEYFFFGMRLSSAVQPNNGMHPTADTSDVM